MLQWVPYDLNLSFQMKGGLNRTALTFEMNEVKVQWPLIRYLIDNPEYFAFYKASVKEFVEKTFTPALMTDYLNKHKSVLAPHFTPNEIEKHPFGSIPNSQSFDQSVIDLDKYIKERHASALEFIK